VSGDPTAQTPTVVLTSGEHTDRLLRALGALGAADVSFVLVGGLAVMAARRDRTRGRTRPPRHP
jgi:hypothetical protein